MENKIKDIHYDLTTFLEAQATKKLKPFKMEIESNRYIICKSDNDTVKIYSPELAVILSSNSLSVINMDTNTATTINGLLYLNTYIEAYKEGENYFETQHRVSPNTLYGANAEQYVRDIHFKYFHKKHTNMIEGWESVKQQYPFILTHKAVKELGFYSGIVNKVDEQIEDNPNLFATFDKCIHNLPTQQTETKTERGTPIFTNNFDKITPTEIYIHFKAGLVEKQYLTEQELNAYLKAAFELKTIPETLFKIKDAPKKSIIEEVFYKYYKNVAGKPHGKQKQYAALLGDYFEGYKTNTVSSNFSKSVY
jgi:hypothetical protein